MQTASLDLCKELYELSGWDSEVYFSEHGDLRPVDADDIDESKPPAYTLGYLIRKLPVPTEICKGLNDYVAKSKTFEEMTNVPRLNTAPRKGRFQVRADTPEDACAKLAIELFKQGVLK